MGWGEISFVTSFLLKLHKEKTALLFFFKSLLRYNQHTIQVTYPKYTIQWFLVYSQTYAAITKFL